MSLTVIGEYNTVYAQRDRRPLILLDSAIIMGLEVNGIVILIDRIGLKVESGRIDMCSKDIKSFNGTLLADNSSGKALALNALVNLVTGF